MLIVSQAWLLRSKFSAQAALALSSTSCFHLRQHLSTLAYEEITCEPPTPSPTVPTHSVMVLHGLLGSARNWRSFSRALGDAAAKKTQHRWRMLLVDLRCHGASSRLHDLRPPHNMQSAAADVAHLIACEKQKQQAAPLAILGHSMGGKVLLELLQQLQRSTSAQHTQHDGSGRALLPAQAWVLDSQPGKVAAEADARTGVAKVLQTVYDIPLPIPSRVWLASHLKEKGFSTSMANWLGSNVAPDSHGNLTWVFNPDGASALYHSYQLTEYWGLLQHPPARTALHVVVAGRSDRWPPDQKRALEEVQAFHQKTAAAAHAQGGTLAVHVLPKAGHWVHVDDPVGLSSLLLPHLCNAAADTQASKPS